MNSNVLNNCHLTNKKQILWYNNYDRKQQNNLNIVQHIVQTQMFLFFYQGLINR